ncbi:1-(5-phosphoribosyl)-5-[(5-phosphoribosylamino)methylideneamino]imidazole-4-carboxamide isomerase [Capillibacterium thermochitinicola]|uniref:1-(5-phosphoribosyl)-5-[(5-phosphoribosylamino)methylideneamino] imidazole-4-carboxamide isomerase n=1 Tax=Capillibacterium thermochitinicola TaxID=2699427 RepID=A0A8J6I1T5_9FIRM|nr:1-(5-phosphoribosyl)-5-[(5-phosphoribosylamino)methylideneamino]imidazole-4-carboxamide isomerase [Capillibacterium thermochitinicola]MBA2134170.1 1-(5-phosphoribosyl)-5-[(5-phosphoribosylamino)methylideneamino]imidazole-4-carboxamide isomerase [Capillibacterium thermochitinicola]
MIVFPAIDLKDGQCVRLVQGRADQKTVYADKPDEVARRFAREGAAWLHVVDLDGAFSGSSRNLKSIERIARAVDLPFQVGGGLRSRADVQRILELGAARVIIGTKAVSAPEFVQELLEEFGPERIIIGIDARDGRVAVEGWVSTVELSAEDFGTAMRKLGVTTAVFTDISRDGLLTGPNIMATRKMAEKTGLKIIASGGVSSLRDIQELKKLEAVGVSGVIIGKALYNGAFSLAEALAAAG